MEVSKGALEQGEEERYKLKIESRAKEGRRLIKDIIGPGPGELKQNKHNEHNNNTCGCLKNMQKLHTNKRKVDIDNSNNKQHNKNILIPT